MTSNYKIEYGLFGQVKTAYGESFSDMKLYIFHTPKQWWKLYLWSVQKKEWILVDKEEKYYG